MRHNIYLKAEAETALQEVFESLKKQGEIPPNAVEIGKYRAQCITYCIEQVTSRNPHSLSTRLDEALALLEESLSAFNMALTNTPHFLHIARRMAIKIQENFSRNQQKK